VPIALVAILAAIPLMEESRAHGNTRYDLPGVILIVAGLASLVYGFSQAENGWGRVETIGFLALGVVLLVAFVIVEARATNPLLPLRVVTDRVRGGAFLVSLLTGASLLGGLFFLTLYFQIVLGYSPLRSGLASLPMTATIMVCATALSGILPKIGVRLPLTIGPVIAAAGLAWLSFVTVQDDYVLRVLPGVILLGIGLAAIFVPLQNVALAGIDAHDAGVASAAVSATQQIGGSIGTALFTALYTAAISSYLASNPATPTVQLDAFVSGYSVAFLWAAGLILLAAPISFFMIKHSKADLVGAPEIVHLG
jgi:hypothetical protein